MCALEALKLPVVTCVAKLKTNMMYLLSVNLDIADLVMKAKEPVRPYNIKKPIIKTEKTIY